MGITLLIIWCVLFALTVFYKLYEDRKEKEIIEQVTSLKRGNRAERKFIVGLVKSGVLPIDIYHDIYIKRENGNYAQIDLVILTETSIIVVEIKEYSGWIFGDCTKKEWTQILDYGKQKYKFYNPVLQNISHINALKEQNSILSSIPIYSLIYFKGNCELKNISNLVSDTLVVDENSFKFNDIFLNKLGQILSEENKEIIRKILLEGHENGNDPNVIINHNAYVAHIRDRFK